MPKLILASASPYKRTQMGQLQLPFEAIEADINETPRASESPKETAIRLAMEKALTVSQQHPNAYVVGCDQTASLNGQPLGKPLSADRSKQQLSQCSGKVVTFYSAVSLTHASKGFTQTEVSETQVHFRDLSTQEINNYIEHEDALNCAGGFKVECLGISLFKKITSDDPSAIIGLPLIALTQLLIHAGLNPLKE